MLDKLGRKCMKNKCVYTKEVVKGYHYVSFMYYFKNFVVVMLIVFIIALINFITKLTAHNIGVYTVALVFVPIVFLLAMIEKEKKGIKVESERMSIMYGKTEVETIVELYDNIKMITESKNEREISYDHIITYKETKNLIVIILKGRMLIPLSKDGFIDGDVESCKKLLNSKIKV